MDRAWVRQLTDRVVAARSQRVICLLIGLCIINAFDAVLTVLAHGQGMLDESNPIALRLLALGPSAILIYKLVLVGFASTILLIQRRQLLSELAATGMLLVYILVAIRWQSCYELYLTTGLRFASTHAMNA